MFKKICLTLAALLPASLALAQTPTPTISTTYSTAPTIQVNGPAGCIITQATALNYDPNTNTITIVNGVDSCYNGVIPPKQASINISINTSNYTIGSGAAAPVVSVTNQTAGADVTCSLNPTSGGFTATPASITNSGTFTLSTPATAGTYSFVPTCTTATAGYSPTVLVSGSASLTVVPTCTGANCTQCSAQQISTPLGGKTFQRQCSGNVTMYPSGAGWVGALTDMSTVFGNKPFPVYTYSGQAPTFFIDSGYYVALAFTPAASGLIKFTANNSYGDGGTISLSTSPGGLTAGQPGVICAATYGGLNSLLASTSSGSCMVTMGQTYYINFADTNSNGDNLCFGGSTGGCSQSRVSYSFTARAQ